MHASILEAFTAEFTTTGVNPNTRKVGVRLPGKGNSNSHGARPVHLVIWMIEWIQTSRLSMNNSLYLLQVHASIQEAFTAKFTAKMATLKAGLPWEKGVDITPLPEPSKPAYAPPPPPPPPPPPLPT